MCCCLKEFPVYLLVVYVNEILTVFSFIISLHLYCLCKSCFINCGIHTVHNPYTLWCLCEYMCVNVGKQKEEYICNIYDSAYSFCNKKKTFGISYVVDVLGRFLTFKVGVYKTKYTFLGIKMQILSDHL